jgi:hypothetical protein
MRADPEKDADDGVSGMLLSLLKCRVFGMPSNRRDASRGSPVLLIKRSP